MSKIYLKKVKVALGHGCEGCYFDGKRNITGTERIKCLNLQKRQKLPDCCFGNKVYIFIEVKK